ncbi:sensor histidine kinase [Arthrobacter sp. H14]|uniref:sensor histidine kinase n=1 Tax=Arthrobacter sp. H14 TaxID=1312959 RepID=UPI000479667F|nr:HAMP domain-containing sensor histidine kinase [Arthrobacter sp. H14]
MSNWRPRRLLDSIRVRIVAVIVALLLLSSIGSVLLLRVVLFEHLDAEIRTSLRQETEEFQLLAAGTDPRTGQPFGNDLSAIFDVYFSREVPDEGETLLAFIDGELYESRRSQGVAAPGEIQSAINYWLSLEQTEQGMMSTAAGSARYVAIPVEGQPNGGLFVVANFPAFERDEINNAVQTQIIVQAATLLVASLLALALAGRVLLPLHSLAATARKISDTDLSQRIEVTGHDEASQIAAAFNDMLTRLEQAFTDQRQFLNNTSHELRTPLTIIRGHIELIELDETPAERAKTVALVTEEIDRMNELVSNLFLLAQAQRPDFLQLEPMDVQDLVSAVHRKATALAPRDWQVHAPQRIIINADRNRLTQGMLQLAENAVKFTDDDSVIRVGADVAADTVTLWVVDTGPGVPAEEAAHIFERFRRGSAKVRGGSQGGAGLGLSIVAAIADAHGGSARVIPGIASGARFEIVVPFNR